MTLPAAGPALADEDADGGGFAGAVGAEQPEQFAAADVEVEPVHGRERAVEHAQPRDADHHVSMACKEHSPQRHKEHKEDTER